MVQSLSVRDPFSCDDLILDAVDKEIGIKKRVKSEVATYLRQLLPRGLLTPLGRLADPSVPYRELTREFGVVGWSFPVRTFVLLFFKTGLLVEEGSFRFSG